MHDALDSARCPVVSGCVEAHIDLRPCVNQGQWCSMVSMHSEDFPLQVIQMLRALLRIRCINQRTSTSNLQA